MRKKFRTQAVTAGAAVALALAASLGMNKAVASDQHQQPVSDDADDDLLSNLEELALGYQPFRGDQNRNEIPDGAELAKRCAEIINLLPRNGLPGANQIYRICHEVDGLERCDVCGEWIHMGGCCITNPKLGLRYPDPHDPLDPQFLPDLALHYMEHGSFDCAGSIHTGRVDLPRLMRVLEVRFPYDPNEHQLPVDANDLDGDLLTDNEELSTGYNVYDADQDGDLTPDGIELARQCAEVIGQLTFGPDPADANKTYIDHWPTFGLETCEICGATVNMGPAWIVNPRLGLSVDCPLIAMHYMGHGSFEYSGDVHGRGRLDVPLLLKALEMPRQCGHLGTIYLPGDHNRDCKENLADFAEFADKWLRCTDPNDGQCD